MSPIPQLAALIELMTGNLTREDFEAASIYFASPENDTKPHLSFVTDDEFAVLAALVRAAKEHKRANQEFEFVSHLKSHLPERWEIAHSRMRRATFVIEAIRPLFFTMVSERLERQGVKYCDDQGACFGITCDGKRIVWLDRASEERAKTNDLTEKIRALAEKAGFDLSDVVVEEPGAESSSVDKAEIEHAMEDCGDPECPVHRPGGLLDVFEDKGLLDALGLKRGKTNKVPPGSDVLN